MIYPYADPQQYLTGTVAYIEQARAADAAVVVVTPQERRDELLSRLGADDSVTFMDTTSFMRSPSRLLPTWQDWIGRQADDGRIVHGVNDTTWPTRGRAYDDETRYAEWLLNRAFAEAGAWSLLCPVDTTLQAAPAIEALTRCHPWVWNGTESTTSSEYRCGSYGFEDLLDPPQDAPSLAYGIDDLPTVRWTVADAAKRAGFPRRREGELVLAVSEVATNSIRYGGGSGSLRIWRQDGSLVCEMRDAGVITDPLAGRLRPSPSQLGGRGLWYVYQTCDLVQLRSVPGQGTRIQLWVDLPDA
jgi:anti-sigma regulatory factor (Ser/Thr protein kinase)